MDKEKNLDHGNKKMCGTYHFTRQYQVTHNGYKSP